MSRIRTALVTSIMAPHRIALFNQLSAHPAIDLTIVYLARSDPSRRWRAHEEEIQFRHTVLRGWGSVRRGDGYVHITSGLWPVLRRARPDVLIVGGWDQFAYHEAHALRPLTGARLLWWVESNLRDRRSERSVTRALKRRLLASADGCIVPGTASLRYVESLGADPSRVWIAPNAVDNALYEAAVQQRTASAKPRFLSVGRLESSKGVAALLDAWAQIGNGNALSIVGTGSLETSVRRRVDRAAMPSVELLGHRDRDELISVYADADVFVFPSVSDPWGLVLNEAMAAGLPVVTTTAPGAVDDLVIDGDNGLIVPPHDPGRLAGAMRRLMDDEDERIRMGERSSDRIRAFDPQHWADGMHDAIARAVGSRI